MIPAEETFEGTWPFQARFCDAARFRMHYVDEGPRHGHSLVLLHGEPTWGYLWRHLIAPLSRKHRVVVPDHMGFGKSETPQDRTYLADEHVDNLEKLLVDTLDLSDITLVLHDWGGPIGAGFALRHPDRIARIFATNTVLPMGSSDEYEAANKRDSLWFQWARQAHNDGTFEQVLGNAGNTVTHLMLALQTITHPEIVTPTWVRAYSSPFTSYADCRGVIRFPLQLIAPGALSDVTAPGEQVAQPAFDPVAVDALRGKPAVLVEGMRDTALLPQHMIQAFRADYPHAPIIELAEVGHFTPEDAPTTLLALLELFLLTT
ncbi:haloalkane dehalogenase [Mycobacteroides abscessus subsp. abscessus]|uniref:alpha/beta fold hydrolase n=2 Tax=Mycobacteroides abscessus TaxID=36809 RepID=UPI0009A7496B|nr:alpha/beta fold hydrolase [Mycobacteroides abscessus]SKV13283.1 haloalkane dehalogenase [Mycobacteroides abscessus subsp. abscessus]SKY60153.1 haloalkane dehalogenase [Mycobacteroides abscessus subsp. abscessus]